MLDLLTLLLEEEVHLHLESHSCLGLAKNLIVCDYEHDDGGNAVAAAAYDGEMAASFDLRSTLQKFQPQMILYWKQAFPMN